MPDCQEWASAEISPGQVQRRRAEARRNGNATWLWPDVDIAHWRNALEEIVAVTRSVLAGTAGAELACDDPQAMCIAAYSSGMGPLLGFWIENGTVRASGEIGALLRLHLFHNRRRMACLETVLHKTVQALNTGNVTPLILKGMDTAFRYFPEPGTRALSDIDLFVSEKSVPQAEQIFSGLGYRRILRMRTPYACDWVDPHASPLPRTLTMVHENDPWSIDVLGSLDKRLPTGTRARFDALLARTPLAGRAAAGRAQIMPQPLLMLYLAAHFSQTLLNATVLRAVEMVLVIRRDTALGTFDWESFARDAAALGGLRFVYPALVFAEQLAPGAIPAKIMDAATDNAPKNLRIVMAGLSLATAQPLDRHSIRERFMWATDWREYALQIASELSFDGRGAPLGAAAYSIGTKLWALRRRRYSS